MAKLTKLSTYHAILASERVSVATLAASAGVSSATAANIIDRLNLAFPNWATVSPVDIERPSALGRVYLPTVMGKEFIQREIETWAAASTFSVFTQDLQAHPEVVPTRPLCEGETLSDQSTIEPRRDHETSSDFEEMVAFGLRLVRIALDEIKLGTTLQVEREDAFDHADRNLSWVRGQINYIPSDSKINYSVEVNVLSDELNHLRALLNQKKGQDNTGFVGVDSRNVGKTAVPLSPRTSMRQAINGLRQRLLR